MKSKEQVAKEWLDEANSITTELSKTLLIVSATLLVFLTAIPANLGVNIGNPLWTYRIPWVLILLSLFCGILKHLLRERGLRMHASKLYYGNISEVTISRDNGDLEARFSPYRGETACSFLQPLLLLLGLAVAGFAMLW